MNNQVNRTTVIWQASQWPALDYDQAAIAPALQRATTKLGQVAGLHESFGTELRQISLAEELAHEVVASYAIEGEDLDFNSVTASVMASLDHQNVHHLNDRSPVAAQLTLQARQPGALTEMRLCDWHRLMFNEPVLGLETVGAYRKGDMRVVSGRLGNYRTEYEAPPASKLEAFMADFLLWLSNENQQPALVKAALAHLWFETIHPFEDGNGRLGRLIVEHELAQLFTTMLPISPSRSMLRHRQTYYNQLKQAQHAVPTGGDAIDVTDFVQWFLEILSEAADESLQSLRFITRRNHFFERWSNSLSPRQTDVLRRLFEGGEERVAQGISRKPYKKIAKVSDQTAVRDLRDLLNKGVILAAVGGGRSTTYPLNW